MTKLRPAAAAARGAASRLRDRRVAMGLVAAAAAALLVLAPKETPLLARLYERVAGPADLGPVDFATLVRRTTPNDALACPPGACSEAAADFDPGVYPLPVMELRRRFAAMALAEPRVVQVHRGAEPDAPQDRYVQRSRLMSFPDTIDVRFVPLSAATSTLAVYSRSQLGRGDLGVNLARIRLWTGKASP